MATRRVCLFACLALSAAPLTAHGQEVEHDPASHFPVTVAVDVPVLATGFLFLAIPPLVTPELSKPHCGSSTTPACNANDLNPLDRFAITADSQTSALVSDIMLYATPALAAGVYAVTDGLDFGWEEWGEDIVIMGEVATLSGGIQQLMSLAVRRPRPYMYTPGLRTQEERDAPGATQSFFSGHASTVFGIATSFAYIVTRRRPDMKHKWLVWAASLAIATPMPFLRVDAGSHFWTDTLTGTVLGVGAGLVIPYLHEKKRKLGPIALRPVFAGGNVGVAGSW